MSGFHTRTKRDGGDDYTLYITYFGEPETIDRIIDAIEAGKKAGGVVYASATVHQMPGECPNGRKNCKDD